MGEIAVVSIIISTNDYRKESTEQSKARFVATYKSLHARFLKPPILFLHLAKEGNNAKHPDLLSL